MGMMDYFLEMKCTQAAAIAQSLLQSDAPNTREFGCYALGKIGGTSNLPAMRILATKDASHKVVEERPGVFVKVLHVAAACQTAMSKIELRK